MVNSEYGDSSEYERQSRSSKKRLYKKWWFWLLLIVVASAIYRGVDNYFYGSKDGTVQVMNSETGTRTANANELATQPNTPAPTPEALNSAQYAVSSTPSDGLSMGQRNALEAAKSYLEYSAFSYDGLVKQLEFEKYTEADALFAANNCGADWNEQAVKAAASYLEYSSFSKDGLIDQLEFDGFTYDQALYGAYQNGYE